MGGSVPSGHALVHHRRFAYLPAVHRHSGRLEEPMSAAYRRAHCAALVVLALSLASCASDELDCPTCPPENSARISVWATFDVDSAHVSIDGSPNVTVEHDETRLFSGLASGTHTMNARLYHSDRDGFVTTKDVTLQIVLARGEAKTVVFHHDFAGVVYRLPEEDPGAASFQAG
jgi:hypothetical protein